MSSVTGETLVFTYAARGWLANKQGGIINAKFVGMAALGVLLLSGCSSAPTSDASGSAHVGPEGETGGAPVITSSEAVVPQHAPPIDPQPGDWFITAKLEAYLTASNNRRGENDGLTTSCTESRVHVMDCTSVYPDSVKTVQRFWIAADGMHMDGAARLVNGVQIDPDPAPGG